MPISIKDVVNAAAGAAVQPGQVVEFFAGSVPGDYIQVGGPAAIPDAGRYNYDSIYYRDSVGQMNSSFAYRWKLIAAGQRMYGIGSNATVNQLHELDPVTLLQKDAGVPVPTTGVSSGSRHVTLIPLSDGRLLRVGGSESGTVSNICQIYNPATSAFSAVSNIGTSVVPTYSAGAQAGDGKVYGMFASTSTGYTSVSRFDPVANVWTHPIATAPIASDKLIDIAKLPSGNLLFAFTTAQYVFNTVDASFTLIAGRTLGATAALLEMPNFVRVYTGDARTNRMSYIDFTDTGAASEVITNIIRPYRESTALRLSASKSPATGDIFIKAVVATTVTNADEMIRQSAGYTPAVTVKAMKV